MNPLKLEILQRKQRLSKEKSYKKHLINKNFKPEYVLRHHLNEIRASNRCGSHCGCIRISPSNTRFHEYMKFQVCYELARLGHKYITEAIFENNKRADIVDLNTGIIYEIVYSEKEESIKEKENSYPRVFQIIKIDASKPFEKEMIVE